MGGETAIEQEARLIILRELHAQSNRSMTSSAVRNFLLNDFLINRSRGWVEDQFEFLAERKAVRITAAGSVKIATITPRGLEHLALQTFISGVDSPSEPVL
ncbi:hypothetical protein ASD64_07155 [Mesorhizobium sp. Root157]|uniref:VpaChn25_0724 family phage protein n=1 Tax=Mesorhizobium sp. Root157 TaxID=1736477 RepID=UPI0006F72C1D|nr:hypothetical protein [Mesorhizobium sp. Root157]KQZ87210.1 hypothetical protein ASD64_07155 [Mesorhizobium sp. Root157]